MGRIEIRDNSNKLIGYTEERGDGRVFILNERGAWIGWYDKHADRTFDVQNRPVGTGNQLMRLLR